MPTPRPRPPGPPRAPPSRQAGLSLIELLVGMTLGLFLIAGLVGVFAGNQRSAELNTAMSTLQENARFALDAIVRDVRMGGHQGCLDANGGAVAITAAAPPTRDLAATGVTGAVIGAGGAWNPVPALGTGSDAFVAPGTRPAVPGTHAIVVQFGGPDSAPLAFPMRRASGRPDPYAPLRVAGDLGLETGDHAIVANCETGELFEVTGVVRGAGATAGTTTIEHAAGANSRASFLTAYGGAGGTGEDLRTRVMPLTTSVYYVGETDRSDRIGNPVRALYQWSMPFDEAANPPVELIDGLESLRASFGVGAGLAALRYVAADDAAFEPRQVRSVRVGLLMRSAEEVADADDATVYVLAGEPISPAAAPGPDAYVADRRFRLAFNTTVKVRNRRAAR